MIKDDDVDDVEEDDQDTYQYALLQDYYDGCLKILY